MKPTKQPIRKLLAQVSKVVAKETLNFRVYREHSGFLCERELIQRDGSRYTQALSFEEIGKLERFLRSDPHYPAIKKEAEKLIDILEPEVIDGNTTLQSRAD